MIKADLILFIVATLVYVALQAVYYYQKNRKGKIYEILRKASFSAWLLSAIFGSWFFLDALKDGFDSPVGWWFLCFLIGWSVAGVIMFLVPKACKAIWPEVEGQFPVMDIVKMPKWVGIVGHALLIAFAVAFLIGIVALLISKFHEIDTGMLIMAIVCALMMIYGIFYSAKRIAKYLKK